MTSSRRAPWRTDAIQRIQTGETYTSIAADIGVSRQRVAAVAREIGHRRKRGRGGVIAPPETKRHHTWLYSLHIDGLSVASRLDRHWVANQIRHWRRQGKAVRRLPSGGIRAEIPSDGPRVVEILRDM